MINYIKKHQFAFRFFSALICLIAALLIEKIFTDINEYVILIIILVGYLIMSYDLYIEAFESIKNKEFFTEETLTIIASVASICIGEFIDGLAVILFFQIGEFFEDYALDSSKKSIESILSLKPKTVHKIFSNEIKDVDPNTIKIDDEFIVNPGELIPIDGEIIDGNSSINASSITGESLPINLKPGDTILSGMIVIDSVLKICAKKEFHDSTVSKILDIIENANDKKTSSEKFITKFAKIYTPIVIGLAFCLAIFPPLYNGIFLSNWNTWKDWIYRGASMLVISCPCALVISIPMSFVVSIGVASKNKIIIKGSTYLELLAKANTLYLDKTGTITKGNFVVDSIITNENIGEDKLLNLAKIAEKYSTHPIAKAIINNNEYVESGTNYKELSGKGISCIYQNKELKVGNFEFVECETINPLETTGTVIYIVYDNSYLGAIILKDQIKTTSMEAIKKIKHNGIKKIMMLTGDNERIAKEICEKVGLSSYKSNMLPIDKTNCIQEGKKDGEISIFVGDGINDAPSLIKSDIGVSMGKIGSDSAIEASDIVIMDDNLNKVNYLIELSKINKFVVYWNIIFSIIMKIAAIVLNTFGILENYAIVIAIFADVGVTIICCINSLLITLKKK